MSAPARILGGIVFWMSWPFFYLYLKNTQRTRVLVTAGGKVLLVQSWHGTGAWSLPGGGIEKKEDPAFAAIRELQEETGITLGTDQLKLLDKQPYKSHGLRFECYYFLAELKKPITATPKLPEIIAAEWVDERSLGEYKLAADAEAALSARNALLQ